MPNKSQHTIIRSPLAEFVRINNSLGNKPFNYDDENKSNYRLLFDYFARPHSKLDKNKGIMLIGNCGTGKTRLMRAFGLLCAEFNGFNKFNSLTINELQDMIQFSEREDMARFRRVFYTNEASNLYLDDLGTETKILNYFGTQTNWLEKFILERYEVFSLYGIRLHVSTNLSKNELKSRYSERVFDRFKEMFNIVYLVGESYRGKNTS